MPGWSSSDLSKANRRAPRRIDAGLVDERTNALAKSKASRSGRSLLSSLVTETSGEGITLGQLMSHRRAAILRCGHHATIGLIAISPLRRSNAGRDMAGGDRSRCRVLHPDAVREATASGACPRSCCRPGRCSARRWSLSLQQLRETAHTADRLTTPRLVFLTRPPFVIATALICVLASPWCIGTGPYPLRAPSAGVIHRFDGSGVSTASDGSFASGRTVLGGFCHASCPVAALGRLLHRNALGRLT